MGEQIRILCVDDERNVLRTLERLFFDDDYEILTAMSGAEGLEILKNITPIQIVISDYRMEGMNGVDFLKKVCEHWPDTIRIVLSGYADTKAVISAINEGEIYKFIPKPWDDNEFRFTISDAISRYFLYKENKELTEKFKKKNEELKKLNDNLEKLVFERTSELEFQNKVLIKSQNILDSLPVGILGIDKDGIIVQCNHKVMELLNGCGKSILGMDRREVLNHELNIFIEKVIEKKFLSCQTSICGAYVEIRGKLMKYPEGQEGVVLVFI